MLQAQLNDMRKMIEISMFENRRGFTKGSISTIEYERISNKLDKLINSRKRMPKEVQEHEFHRLMVETEKLSMHCHEKGDHRMFRFLMERIQNAMHNEFDSLL